jgi:hypothetical protein
MDRKSTTRGSSLNKKYSEEYWFSAQPFLKVNPFPYNIVIVYKTHTK